MNTTALSDPPPGVNPFDQAAQGLRLALFFEDLPTWFRVNSIIFLVLLILSVLFHILGIVVPLFGGRSARARHLWVVRTMHSGAHNIPYVVPNGRLFSAVFSIAAATIYCLMWGYLLWSPETLNAAILELPPLIMWWQYWLTSFDALFAIWISGTRNSQSSPSLIRNPWLLNTFCWATPVVMSVMQLALLGRLFTIYAGLHQKVEDVLGALAVASAAFKQGGMAAVQNMAEIQTLGADVNSRMVPFAAQSSLVLKGEAGWFAVNMALFAISLAVLVHTVWTRLYPKRRSMPVYRMKEHLQQHGGTLPGTFGGASTTAGAGATGAGTTNASIARLSQGGAPHQTRALKKQYRLLLVFFAYLAVLVFWQGGEILYIQGHAEDLQLNARPYQVWFISAFWPECTFLFMISILSFYRVCDRHPLFAPGRTPSEDSKGTPTLKTRAIGLFGKAWQTPAEDEQEATRADESFVDPHARTLVDDGRDRGRDRAIFVSVMTRRSVDEDRSEDEKMPA